MKNTSPQKCDPKISSSQPRTELGTSPQALGGAPKSGGHRREISSVFSNGERAGLRISFLERGEALEGNRVNENENQVNRGMV
jgi:hypothetical protein